MDIVYFDNSATTKPHIEVIEEAALCLHKYYANPSSAHRLGVEAEKKMKTAREKVAGFIGAKASEVVFTSGGSEANNLAIAGVVSKGDHIIASAIEHPSVHKFVQQLEAEGVEATWLSVDSRGIIDLAQLETSIRDNTKLVTIMHVNNEVGVIQPIADVCRIVRAKSRKARIHIDAVQSAGKLPINVKKLDVDLLSLSGHKIHGPKGIGALYIKAGVKLKPLIVGGGQEGDIRSGTENLPFISAYGVACEMASKNMESKLKHVAELKRSFIAGLQEISGVLVNSPLDDCYVPHILNVSFENVRGEVLLHALEDYNIFISTGSACSAKKASARNHVLPAMGLLESQILGAVRFSFSYTNTMEEVQYTLEALKKALPFLRRINK